MNDHHHDRSHEPLEPTRAPDAELIRRARTKYGAIGAIVASGMLGLDKILGRKPKEEGAVVWEASGEPGNIDKDGITVRIDATTTAHASLTVRNSGRHVRKRRYRT